MEEKPFWEKSYSETGAPLTFNEGKPSWDVVEVLNKYLSYGKVLDLGSGDGRNALYAASRGYEVTALDISENGISKIKSLSKKNGYTIDARICDMRDFQSKEEFDLVISHGCLHLIGRNEWVNVIDSIMSATKTGGYNITLVFTDKLPLPEDMKPFTKGLFRDDELFTIYKDWNIIHKNSYEFEDEHGNGIKHRHAANRLIAQKLF